MPVYMIRAGEHGPVKIGWSENVVGRLSKMRTDNHETLTVLRIFEGGPEEERQLHSRFADLHLHGGWHSFSLAMLGDVGLVESYKYHGPVRERLKRQALAFLNSNPAA